MALVENIFKVNRKFLRFTKPETPAYVHQTVPRYCGVKRDRRVVIKYEHAIYGGANRQQSVLNLSQSLARGDQDPTGRSTLTV